VDKGTAVAALVAEADVSAACCCGDDVGDLAAFAALDDLPVALRVAVRSAETPPELTAAADLVVDGPDGVLELLRALAP
jgi:trehalose 6-phosphate phosphatase